MYHSNSTSLVNLKRKFEYRFQKRSWNLHRYATQRMSKFDFTPMSKHCCFYSLEWHATFCWGIAPLKMFDWKFERTYQCTAVIRARSLESTDTQPGVFVCQHFDELQLLFSTFYSTLNSVIFIHKCGEGNKNVQKFPADPTHVIRANWWTHPRVWCLSWRQR